MFILLIKRCKKEKGEAYSYEVTIGGEVPLTFSHLKPFYQRLLIKANN